MWRFIVASKTLTPPSGTRDFLPNEMVKRKHVIGIVSKIYESHGYQPMETPSMERLSVLLGKYGEEGEKLVFKILHRGRKLDKVLESPNLVKKDLSELGLRYDLTVPLARVYSHNGNELSPIFKRYQIQPVWRADRPARGRFREFYQCDVDIIGSNELFAEIDIFIAVCEIMDLLGFKDYHLLLNHRKLLSAIVELFGLKKESETQILISLDKLDKIGREGVSKDLTEKGVSPEILEKFNELFDLMEIKDLSFNKMIDWFDSKPLSQDGKTAISEIKILHEWAENSGIENHILFNPLLARGLDYYTGPVFELRLEGESSSVGGGGRYDDLIGDFGGRKTGAVGFSFGLERVLVLMEERKMFIEQIAIAPVTVAFLDTSVVSWGLKVLSKIRETGIRTDLFPRSSSPGKVFKWASKVGVKFVVLIGSDEKESQVLTIKNLVTGVFEKVPFKEINTFFNMD
jgi:histidyl-tRNA synthetase